MSLSGVMSQCSLGICIGFSYLLYLCCFLNHSMEKRLRGHHGRQGFSEEEHRAALRRTAILSGGTPDDLCPLPTPGHRGLCGPASGECEPTEMAPGAYHLVLRNLCIAALYVWLQALSPAV